MEEPAVSTKTFKILGALFLFHALLISPSVRWDQTYVPFYSPLISAIAGISLLLFDPQKTKYSVIILYFVAGRSLLGLGVGLNNFFLDNLPTWLQHMALTPVFTVTLARSVLSWILFAFAILLSIKHLHTYLEKRRILVTLLRAISMAAFLFIIGLVVLGKMLQGIDG